MESAELFTPFVWQRLARWINSILRVLSCCARLIIFSGECVCVCGCVCACACVIFLLGACRERGQRQLKSWPLRNQVRNTTRSGVTQTHKSALCLFFPPFLVRAGTRVCEVRFLFSVAFFCVFHNHNLNTYWPPCDFFRRNALLCTLCGLLLPHVRGCDFDAFVAPRCGLQRELRNGG